MPGGVERGGTRTRRERLDYRPDIDGLRAVAVVGVMLFHGGVAPFSGGFAGVDVFFVISGFLITSILVRDLEAGSFSLGGFYERRVRRIFPALFVVVAVCGAVALALFMPLDLRQFGASAAAAASFASNLFFWHEVGYFDTPAESKPLLHTWSLAIEEQFYILFPLFLILARRFGKSRWWWFVVAVLSLSFALSLASSFRAPALAFYWAPMRAWELLAGSVLALRILPLPVGRAAREASALAGLLLVVGAFVMIAPTTPFPGFAALAPCLGTAMLIAAGVPGPTVVGRALSLRPVVFVGLISYSLYLWHWPLLVFLQYYLVRPLTPLESGLVLAAAVPVAALSWRFVEVPFRRRAEVESRRGVFLGGLSAVLATAVAGTALYLTGGMPDRFPPEVVRMLAQANDLDEFAQCRDRSPSRIRQGDVCTIGDPDARTSFALWGDSHAQMLVPAVDRAASLAGRSGFLLTRSGCAPGQGARPVVGDRSCEAFNDAVLDLLTRTASLESVLLAGYWRRQSTGGTWDEPDSYFVDSQSRIASRAETGRVFERSLARAIEALGEAVTTHVIADAPEVAIDLPSRMGRLAAFGRGMGSLPRDVPDTRYFEPQAVAFRVFESLDRRMGLRVVHLNGTLCPEGVCPLFRGDDVLYRNGDHLSRRGAMLLVDTFTRVLQESGVLAATHPRRWRGAAPPRGQRKIDLGNLAWIPLVPSTSWVTARSTASDVSR